MAWFHILICCSFPPMLSIWSTCSKKVTVLYWWLTRRTLQSYDKDCSRLVSTGYSHEKDQSWSILRRNTEAVIYIFSVKRFIRMPRSRKFNSLLHVVNDPQRPCSSKSQALVKICWHSLVRLTSDMVCKFSN